MRIKLDHNLSPHLATLLEEMGHDVITAYTEDLHKSDDLILIAEAAKESRVLFTLDKGFADTNAYPPKSHAGIVVFDKKRNETIERVEERLLAFARSRSQRKIEGRTAVVEKTRVRFPRSARKNF